MNHNNIYVQKYPINQLKKITKQISPLQDVIDEICSDKHAEQVEQIRAAFKAGKEDEVHSLKIQIISFRPTLYTADDGNEHATGTIQLDIDKKDNDESLDFSKLKAEITSIPECLYAFISPTGGLKFGIKTDFHGKVDVDDEDSGNDGKILKARFITAYRKVKKHVSLHLKTTAKFDDSPRSIMLSCFLSHDTDAYFNPKCAQLKVDSECVYHEQTTELSEAKHDPDYILELLNHIPRDLEYEKKLLVNYNVLWLLGKSGIPMLVSHWNSKNKSTLKGKIESQLRNCTKGSLGDLIAWAEIYGYKQPENAARRNLRPTPTNIQLPPLKSVAEAMQELTNYVKEFFNGDENTFINISAGSGKTTKVLEVLAKEIPKDKKVLFLVPSHSLAEQIVETFRKLRNNPVAEQIEKRARESRNVLMRDRSIVALQIQLASSSSRHFSDITHLYGQEALCNFRNGKEQMELGIDKKASIPWKFCSGECPINAGCPYLSQFSNRFDNIRLMTHSEWFQEQAKWFNGVRHISDDGTLVYPSDDLWEPDYIIIDENIIGLVDPKATSIEDGSSFPSIGRVLQDISKGMTLVQAIEHNRNQIGIDNSKNEKPQFPSYEGSLTSYLSAVDYWKSECESYSVILDRLNSFAKSNDQSDLLGLWASNGKLYFSEIKQAAPRYKDVPTLFLDATAEERVVKRVLPNIRFHPIHIESKDDIHIYQLANTNISQSWVNSQEGRDELENRLATLIQKRGYKKVGLITYQNAKHNPNDDDKAEKIVFDEYLASRLGATIYVDEHFGNLRGTNDFEDVDCLIVAGRRFIGDFATSLISAAIFGEFKEFRFHNQDSLVRMKDGSCYRLNSGGPSDGYHQAIHDHFSLAETKQAIGRCRSIHGTKKDVYYFSNESLGTDIEVSDFFYWDDYRRKVSPEVMDKFKAIGFVKDKPSELKDVLGFTDRQIEYWREEIRQELIDAGFVLSTCQYKDNKSRLKEWEGYIYEKPKLTEYIVGNGGKLM